MRINLKINKEDLKYIGLGFLYLFLTIGFGFLIFKFGIGAAVKISEFLQKNKPLSNNSLTDNFIPSPAFNLIQEATNSAELSLSGYGPANKEVIVSLNNEENSFTVDSEGKFSGIIHLSLGSNTLSAVTKDFENKTSSPSKTYTIFYSDSPPNLEITSPEQDATIKRNASVSIIGKTDSKSKVYVNDHLITVTSDGTFSYEVKLQRGDNRFKISSIDPAQNKTEKDLTLHFQP